MWKLLNDFHLIRDIWLRKKVGICFASQERFLNRNTWLLLSYEESRLVGRPSSFHVTSAAPSLSIPLNPRDPGILWCHLFWRKTNGIWGIFSAYRVLRWTCLQYRVVSLWEQMETGERLERGRRKLIFDFSLNHQRKKWFKERSVSPGQVMGNSLENVNFSWDFR